MTLSASETKALNLVSRIGINEAELRLDDILSTARKRHSDSALTTAGPALLDFMTKDEQSEFKAIKLGISLLEHETEEEARKRVLNRLMARKASGRGSIILTKEY